jgi:hypothetical protein
MSGEVKGVQLQKSVGMIRSYGAFVVVGAGISAGRYPMTAQLPPLLWQSINDVPEALSELHARTGKTGNAKEILSTDPNTLRIGWQLLREFPFARRSFQLAFAALDADREPSSAHYDLARLVKSGHVEAGVSYNWDTCLERAYERLFGTALPDGLLQKPHGDAARPQDDWVLPDEDGQVPEGVHEHVARLSDRPRTLVVLGYSGSDVTVVESLLAPLEERWPVVRIGPSATGEGAVASTADLALAKFVSELASSDPVNGWKYVTFSRSRSFLAALRGERLRPTDVDACPELPASPRLAERLLAARFATVSGASGTGKSITAFHAARRLNHKGWSVLELKQPGVASMAYVEEFRQLRGPVLAIVDDAQAIDRGVLAEFQSSADDMHAVLLVSTERLETRDDETLSTSQSMEVVHKYCQANIRTVGPLLSELDDRVQWSAFAVTPEQRLELAASTSTEPWLYMFIASGGERRIGGALDRAVDNVDAALVLAFVCISQMTSRDAGIRREELTAVVSRHAIATFCKGGDLQSDCIDQALVFLANEKLIREADGRIRAAHIRVAERALQRLGQCETNAIGAIVRACVRAALLDDSIDITGKFWLFRVFERTEAYRYRYANSIIDEEASTSLLQQCRSATPGHDRGVALNLLSSTEWLHEMSVIAADELAISMIGWFATLTSEEVNGYRWMMSGLRSRHEAVHRRIRDEIPAATVGERLSSAGNRRAAMDWAHLIQELQPDWGDGDRLTWDACFAEGVNAELLARWLSDRDEHSHPFEIYDLIEVLASIAPRVAKAALETCAEEIRVAMEHDLSEAASNFSGWAFGTMMYVAMCSDAPSVIEANSDDDEPGSNESGAVNAAYMSVNGPALRNLGAEVLSVMQKVNWVAATQSLKPKKRYQLHNLDLLLAWLSHLSTDITDEIAVALSTDWLLEIVDEVQNEDGRPGRSFDAIAYWLYNLSAGALGNSIVRAFLETHEEEINPFPSVLVERYPDLAVRFIERGVQVKIQAPHGAGWTSVTADLLAVTGIDGDAGVRWLHRMSSELLDAINAPQKHDLAGIARFISIADELDAAVLDGVISRVDIEDARKKWSARWDDSREAVLPLLLRAIKVTGPAAALAKSIAEPDDSA